MAAVTFAELSLSPKQSSCDAFSGSRKHDMPTSPEQSPSSRRPTKRECTKATPATPTSLSKGRRLSFSPVDSPSRRQRSAGDFATAVSTAAGVAALNALRMPARTLAPAVERPRPVSAPILYFTLPIANGPHPGQAKAVDQARQAEEEVDELDGEDEVQLPSRTPSLSPSPTFASFSTELARLHPLLAECAAHLSKAGLPDLATLRSLTRTELASFLGDVEGITALQRTLLMGRAASEDA